MKYKPMKNQLLLLTFVLSSLISFSQEKHREYALTTGYLGQMGYHPGANLGVLIGLKQWNSEKSKKKGTIAKQNTFFVHPRIGFYTWPRFNSNLMIGSDIGILRKKENKKLQFGYSFGLGYLMKSEVMSTTVNFQGEIIGKERSAIHLVVATLGYSLNGDINEKMGWLGRLNIGYQQPFNAPGAVTAYVELGLTYTLSTSK